MVEAVVAYCDISHNKRIDRACAMNALNRAIREKYGCYRYISKSYSDCHIALAAGNQPITCDIADIMFDGSTDRLMKKMSFYLSKGEMDIVLQYDNPCKYAIYAWTRKECIYKMLNVRNPLQFDALVSNKSDVSFGEYDFKTVEISHNTVLTFCHSGSSHVAVMEYSDERGWGRAHCLDGGDVSESVPLDNHPPPPAK
jgi:hypothetical protein